jgi:hypothetical protein
VTSAVEKARQIGVLHRSPEAEKLWDEAYRGFFDSEPAGMAATVAARPEAQTLRLSVGYALLDGSPIIEVEHLEAALAVWRYCEAAAAYIFGDDLGDPIADRLLAALRDAGADGLDGTQQGALFSRHVNAKRLELARGALERRGLAASRTEETGGRPRVITRAVQEPARR